MLFDEEKNEYDINKNEVLRLHCYIALWDSAILFCMFA